MKFKAVFHYKTGFKEFSFEKDSGFFYECIFNNHFMKNNIASARLYECIEGDPLTQQAKWLLIQGYDETKCLENDG